VKNRALGTLIRFSRQPRLVYVTNAPSTTLVLGGTGKIGSRLAVELAKLGLEVRTAAPKGADVQFDWDDATNPSSCR
jgi:phosphoglycerate dehydrogenase-like enzyme